MERSPANRKFPESIESEMRSSRRRSEAEIHEVSRPQFEEEGVLQPQELAGDVVKGAAAGAIAGLVAGWVMVEFQKAWSKLAEAADERQSRSKNVHEHNVPEHRAVSPEGDQQEQPDDATINTAEKISEGLFGHRLSRKEKTIAGPAVHYGFAVTMGALYGAAAEIAPLTTAGFGTAFGAALFVAADEIAVPALGLSPNVQEADLSKHVYGLASHLVYGASTEALRRTVRTALD